MIISINQPAYLPWLGYFHRIAVSDLHVVLDYVQFEKNSFTNRNKIRTKQGWQWLTVPVETKGHFGDLAIHKIAIDNHDRWAQKHWNAMRLNYARARHFEEHVPFFEELYRRPWTRLNDLVKEITAYLLQAFAIETPLQFSSTMGPSARKDELILELCRQVSATSYLSGPLGRDYLREELFRNADIKVLYHDYVHPRYDQAYPGFEANMSAIDLLFNHGPRSREILMSGNVSRQEIERADARVQAGSK